MSDDGEDPEQIEIAARVVLGLLRLQTVQKGVIPLTELSHYLRMAAAEREKHGDFGAARMLIDWADFLGDWP
ncbi:hypothetical protein [Paracoccus sp. KR1-242]|uniref:hypothetical protein n=1 Tax=Paracoccus sp. KR1-242 TaxID=3410028 RepID=UPI003C0CDC9D